MRTSPPPQTTARKWLFYLADVFFPSFGELQFVMVLVDVLVLAMFSHEVADMLYAFFSDFRSFLVAAIIFIIMLCIVTRQKLPNDLKLWACFFYYGFFAVIAIKALQQNAAEVPIHSVLGLVNMWLIRILLILAAARGVISLLVVRIDTKFLNSLVTQNFKDVQYRPIGFIVASGLTITSTVIVQHFYDDPAVAALLSFTYASAILAISKPYIRKKLTY